MTYRDAAKTVRGFRTGDMVRASVPAGRKAGVHIGRVAVRASGSFNVQTPAGLVQGISWRRCILLCRADGYGYSINRGTGPREARVAFPPSLEGDGLHARFR